MHVESVKEYFTVIVPRLLIERKDRVAATHAVYEFQITGEQGGVWALNLRDEPFSVIEESAVEPDCTIIMKDEDFLTMLDGALKPQMAFLTGKLKVTGNMSLALKLSALFV
jgi:putative sterol carrier protein